MIVYVPALLNVTVGVKAVELEKAAVGGKEVQVKVGLQIAKERLFQAQETG